MKLKGTDLERIFGLSTNAVKYYEKNGILAPQRNPENRYRIYSQEDMQLLGSAQQLRHFGFSVEEAAAMMRSVPEKQGAALKRKEQEITDELERLAMIRDELRR